MNVRIEIARVPGAGDDIPLPSYATPGSSGMDLRASITDPVVIEPGARALVSTGIMVAIPAGHEGQVRARSGLAVKHGIVVVNGPGTIDSDYRGEIKVILGNFGTEPFTIARGDRIAQLVVGPVVRAEWDERDGLGGTPRGAGGFGHTGR